MAGLPEFARFVRSVQGKAVARYGTTGLIGAERVALTEEQKREHVCPIVWDTERVVALTVEYCTRHRRELDAAIRRGELIECKREDWEAQQATTEDTAAEGPQAKRAKRPPKEANQ